MQNWEEQLKNWNWSKGSSIGIVKSSEDYGSLKKVVSELLASTREQAERDGANEVLRIISEELSSSYPDPGKGFRDMIEMDIEDLYDEVDKRLKSLTPRKEE